MSQTASFVEASSEFQYPDVAEDNASDMLRDTKRILYAEASVREDCDSAMDGAACTATLDDNDSESNCDVDEHSDMMHDDGGDFQASPPKMNPVNFDARNVKMILSTSSLNTVPEVNSCGALSSGSVSVD